MSSSDTPTRTPAEGDDRGKNNDGGNEDTAAARVRYTLSEGRTPRRADVRGLLAEHDQLHDDMALVEATSTQRAGQLTERTADRDRLAERLAQLTRNLPPCPATTPVYGSDCTVGLAGHTGLHRTIGGWAWA